MTEKADKVLADRKERTRKQLEKLELEARRRANPAWPYWRKAKINLERIREILASTPANVDKASHVADALEMFEDLVDASGPQPKADAAS